MVPSVKRGTGIAGTGGMRRWGELELSSRKGPSPQAAMWKGDGAELDPISLGPANVRAEAQAGCCLAHVRHHHLFFFF